MSNIFLKDIVRLQVLILISNSLLMI